MASKFDVSQQKGFMAFNGFMGSKSYVEGFQFSPADSEVFSKMAGCPDAKKAPHAYRWYVHIAAISGVRGLSSGAAAAPAAPAKKEKAAKKDKKADKKAAKKPAKEDDDDDFDVFGDDDEEEDEDAGKPKETRAEMLERLKKEANDRLTAKAAKQRTMVAIEVKPWDTEQDLNQLWKKITTEIQQDGVKWGENCHLVEVAFGIKKICMSFVMGANNSSDDIIEQIEALEDEVQSVEMTSMNVL